MQRFRVVPVPLIYALTAAISFMAFFFADRLWDANLHVPFAYASHGDAIEPQMKMLIDGGWFFEPHLAAPFGQDTQAIAQLNALKWALRWVLAELTQSPFMAQNLFEMISPVLSSMTFLYAARRLGLSFAGGIPCAILFANLYEFYWRVLAAHAIQGAYWMTPLGCLALLWICDGIKLRSRDGITFLVIAVLIGLESHYEVFFASCLALVAIVIGYVQEQSLRALRAGVIFIGAMAASFLVNFSPTLIWKLVNHASGYPYARLPVEAFLYSLSIGQMILPNPDHRIHKLAMMREHFDSVFPLLVNENKAATLGFIGDAGLVLLVLALIAWGWRKVPVTIERSALLALAAIILATTGSVGAIVNTFITADIRAYNRISTWIAFFCLLAVGYVLEALWQWMRVRRRGLTYAALASALTVLGVLDQSPAHAPPYVRAERAETEDQAWVDRIAQTLPPDGAVLQLPYAADAESLLGLMQQEPFMLSKDLRWSVGAWNGSRHAKFERWLASLPPHQLVAAALLGGFQGIVVYRSQFPDNGAAIEKQIAAIAGPPLVGEGTSQSYFPLRSLVQAARSADPAVGTSRGIAEAVSMSNEGKADVSESLHRIESALATRAAATREERPGG